MRLNITEEWVREMAEAEDGGCISVGGAVALSSAVATCTFCKGKGFTIQHICFTTMPPTTETRQIPCFYCAGTGSVKVEQL